MLSALFAAMAALFVSACSGGGGAMVVPANRPPAFTSAATASVPENTSGVFYTASASDPDGDALSFSLSGGADRSLFSITSQGGLSFVLPPDFEAPIDADRNNVFLVQISVSDGTTSAILDLAVTVTNGGQDAFRVIRVGAGFAQPVFLTAVPDNSGRVFVVERAGRIRILNPVTAAIASTPLLDVTGQTTTDGERGLLGLALAPDFSASGTFYVYVTNTAGDIEVRRYRTLGANRDQADPASADLILTIPHPVNSNHYGGWMAFGPDGFLYVAVGDGGGAGDVPNNAQNTNVLLGKMLRIDPSRDDFPTDAARDYAIPPSNPFAGGGGRPEIWALGLRNPFRDSFDQATGNLWIGDVGQNAREEIDLMRASDGGANFGWHVFEGTAVFAGPAITGTTPPIAEYLHGSGPRQGNSIIGGYVYRGPIEALRGQYFFADEVDGNIWSLPVAQVSFGTTLSSDTFVLRNGAFVPNAGAINNPASFGLDQAGNLYIVDLDGEIFEVVPA
jgi:glucose/arabinose dehydrogenase